MIRRNRMKRRISLRSGFLVAILGCLVIPLILTACSAKSDKSALPSVLLVTVDTLRADHVGCYGYPRRTTPNIDGLAEHGAVFENACVSAGFSGPSYATILTGTYPFTHTVRDHPQYLPDECLTLAEILRNAGYHTAAMVDEKHFLDRKWNYSQGFQSYRAFKEGKKTTKAAVKWLRSAREPFFLWLMYNEPHFSYSPPEPFDTMFGSPPDGYSPLRDRDGKKISKQRLFFSIEELDLRSEDIEYTVALYDGEIAYTDYLLSRVFEQLERLDMMDRILIVITADHGECLGEDSQYFVHDSSISEATLHVPLILHCPEKIPGKSRVEQLVRSVDIAPTILAALSLPIPSAMEGTNLVPAIKGAQLNLEAYAESRWLESSRAKMNLLHYPLEIPGIEGKLRMVRSGDMKLVRIPTREGLQYKLYDLSIDPREQEDLAQKRLADFETLKKRMDDYIRNDTRPSARGELDERDIEDLRSLGYMD